MKGSKFIDTNILLYLLSSDYSKKTISKEIVQSSCCISTQIMGEFSNICLKKFHVSHEDTEIVLKKIIESVDVFTLSELTIFSALRLKQKYKFQFYDSLVLATAIENNCDILYSEDMQHNQIVENKITIVNPFI